MGSIIFHLDPPSTAGGIITDYGSVTEPASAPAAGYNGIASNLVTVANWGDMPLASSVTPYTDRVFCIGVGVGGSEWYSDGTNYIPSNRTVVLVKNNVPIGSPPSGTIAANGTLTLNTAFPNDDSGTRPLIKECYLYFPAGAFAAKPAGFYYVVMTSTTVGTVYDLTTTTAAQSHAIPTTLPSVVTGSGAAYNAVTGVNLLSSFTIPPIVIPDKSEIVYNYFVATGAVNTNQRLFTTTLTNNSLTTNLEFLNHSNSSNKTSNTSRVKVQKSRFVASVDVSVRINSTYYSNSADWSQNTMINMSTNISTATDWMVLLAKTAYVEY